MLRRALPGLPLLAVLLLLGCRPGSVEPEVAQPFVFSDLNLQQRDRQGRLLWQIQSPETRYDISRRLAQSRQLRGVIYRQGKPLYRLTASNAVVINDGEIVQLEGPTRVQRLDPQRPALLTAQRVRWYPSQQRMEIDRDPRAVQGELELSAGLARFLLDQDRLELRQQPLLRRGGSEPVRLALGQVDWWPASGQLIARGPVQGERTLSDGARQRLTAPALRGNTRSQLIDLQAPVHLEDPSRQAVLEAQATRLDLQRRTASSDLPFSGRYGRSDLAGGGFRLDGASSTVLVLNGCQLRQPGEQLSANRCFWDWRNGQAAASGAVVLRRKAQQLETRAERLEGRIARDGFATFSTPGGQVRSQLRLSPEARRPASADRSGRSARPGSAADRPPPFQL